MEENYFYGIKRFNGSGYENWKYRVEILMQKKNLFFCLITLPNHGPFGIPDFEQKNNDAKHLLVSLIDDTMLHLIMGKKTAQEMWDVLRMNYDISYKKY